MKAGRCSTNSGRPSADYAEQGRKELARQREISRTKRPQHGESIWAETASAEAATSLMVRMAWTHDHHQHPIPNPLGEHASARGTAIVSPRKELAVSLADLSTGPLSLVERFQTLLAVA